jgi:hypothetical protein
VGHHSWESNVSGTRHQLCWSCNYIRWCVYQRWLVRFRVAGHQRRRQRHDQRNKLRPSPSSCLRYHYPAWKILCPWLQHDDSTRAAALSHTTRHWYQPALDGGFCLLFWLQQISLFSFVIAVIRSGFCVVAKLLFIVGVLVPSSCDHWDFPSDLAHAGWTARLEWHRFWQRTPVHRRPPERFCCVKFYDRGAFHPSC